MTEIVLDNIYEEINYVVRDKILAKIFTGELTTEEASNILCDLIYKLWSWRFEYGVTKQSRLYPEDMK